MPVKRLRNLGTTVLKRRKRNANPMQTFDQLPTPLRSWLASASLPWSPQSARRAYAKALARTGDEKQAISALDRIERQQLARDVRQLWGAEHPASQSLRP